jgi:hypothetical protein
MAGKNKNKQRKKIPASVEAQILTECRRRCCLCFYLDDKSGATVQGQIAHIDHNRTNHSPANLAYLCIPHHDTYDSITSQSKGITETELQHAKQSLIAALRKDQLAARETVRLTLTIDSRLTELSRDEREHLIRSLLPSLVQASQAIACESHPALETYSVEITAEDAERICKDFNARKLPEALTGVRITRPQPAKILFDSDFKPEMNGVSKQRAMESLTSHDQAELYRGKQTVAPGELASAGVFTKRYGNGSQRFTVIVITTFDGSKNAIIYAALRAYHARVGNLDDSTPLQCLQSFLRVYGVPIAIPSLDRALYLLGEGLIVPPTVITQRQVFRYLAQFLEHKSADVGRIGAISYTHPSAVSIHLFFCFDRQRYLRDMARP